MRQGFHERGVALVRARPAGTAAKRVEAAEARWEAGGRDGRGGERCRCVFFLFLFYWPRLGGLTAPLFELTGIREALHAALKRRGIDPQPRDPWVFPTVEEYTAVSFPVFFPNATTDIEVDSQCSCSPLLVSNRCTSR